MLAALTKHVNEITPADIDALVERGWPESENVEYKIELPRERGQDDAWRKAGSLTEFAKRKLFKELVAFANTSGGRLFVGIEETRARPPRACRIKPIPRCAELAERLEQSVISNIDPPLTFFRVVPVVTEGDAGIVVADVSASYGGPHRSPDRECYVRKGTNSVPVQMREIHDMVMRLSRRQDEIRQRLSQRCASFHGWMRQGLALGGLLVGCRVTAIPVGAPLYLDTVFRNRVVSRSPVEISGSFVYPDSSKRIEKFAMPWPPTSERPILGGTQRFEDSGVGSNQQVILRDGLIDVWFKWPGRPGGGGQSSNALHFNWIMGSSANVLLVLDRFRSAAQAPACEYGLEVELLCGGATASSPVLLLSGEYRQPLGSAIETPVSLGAYPVGERDAVMNAIVRDLYDASGVPDAPVLEIAWPGAEAFP